MKAPNGRTLCVYVGQAANGTPRPCRATAQLGESLCRVHTPEAIERLEREHLAKAAALKAQLLAREECERARKASAEADEARRRADRAEIERKDAALRLAETQKRVDETASKDRADNLLRESERLLLNAEATEENRARAEAMTALATEIRIADGRAAYTAAKREEGGTGASNGSRRPLFPEKAGHGGKRSGDYDNS